MPPLGRTHVAFILAVGVQIVIVFVIAVRWTHAPRRTWIAALAGGAVAGVVNIATDAGAHALGWWWYPEATTPFGPLFYYVEAGLGAAALAIIGRALRRRFGVRGLLIYLAALAVYGPARDAITAISTGLIAFRYDPWPVVVVADSLSSFLVPVMTAYAVIAVFGARDRA